MSLNMGVFWNYYSDRREPKNKYSNYKHEPNRRFVSTFELLPLADCPLSKIGEAALGDIIFCNYYKCS